MKKVFTITIFILLSSGLQAQFRKGEVLLSGDLNFRSGNSKHESENAFSNTLTTSTSDYINFSTSVSGGFFIYDHIAAGLGLRYEVFSSEGISDNGNSSKSNSNLFSVHVFTRYYIPNSRDFAFYTNFSIGYGFGNERDEYSSISIINAQKQNRSSLSMGVGPGFTYLLNRSIGLDITYGWIGYRTTSTSSNTSSGSWTVTSNSFGIDLSLNSLRLGLSLFL